MAKTNKPPTKHALVEIAQDANGVWRWMLWSSNGIAMATDVGGYIRRADALAAVKNVVRIAQTAKYIVESIKEQEQIIEPEIQQTLQPEEPVGEVTNNEEASESTSVEA